MLITNPTNPTNPNNYHLLLTLSQYFQEAPLELNYSKLTPLST